MVVVLPPRIRVPPHFDPLRTALPKPMAEIDDSPAFLRVIGSRASLPLGGAEERKEVA